MPTKVEPTTLELLAKALAVLRERGMAKYVLEDLDGSVCSRGALIVAGIDGGRNFSRAEGWDWWDGQGSRHEQALREALNRLWPRQIWGGSMVLFNNDLRTTQADVEAVFEEAIRWERERAG